MNALMQDIIKNVMEKIFIDVTAGMMFMIKLKT